MFEAAKYEENHKDCKKAQKDVLKSNAILFS